MPELGGVGMINKKRKKERIPYTKEKLKGHRGPRRGIIVPWYDDGTGLGFNI